MKNSRIKILAASILSLMTLAAIGSVARPAYALTLSPARIEITGDPGTTISASFTMLNEQPTDQVYYTSSANFEADGETGTPHFTDSTTDLASWINADPQISIKRGEQKTENFSISIPKDAAAGGHFAALFLSNSSGTSTSQDQVSVGAKIGILVLLTVSGDVKEGGTIADYGSGGSHFFSSLPISFSYKFQNSGGDRVDPAGTITIKNILGWSKATLPANQDGGNVLPNSSRLFKVVWGNSADSSSNRGFFSAAWYEVTHFAFGIYNADLSLSYGSKASESASASYRIYVFPWHLMTLIALFVLIVGGFFILVLRKYNRWIISKAQQGIVIEK